ncbi:MAG TPA: carboxypeptidase-like regulatory domain-containing protein, partial [Chitinophagaceae bacterium]|nr:carboxypeptidase-like regulatory domain-containing protein [Chitinophagaceae bacterium]
VIKLIQPIIMHGIVLDENNNPVPFASVMIKGTKLGTMANDAGVFKMEKPLLAKELALQISSVGYEQAELSVDQTTDLTKDLLVRLNLKMNEEVVVTTQGWYCGYHRTTTGLVTVVGEVIDTLKTKNEAIIDIRQKQAGPAGDKHSLVDINIPKIYPNPVQRSQVVNVEWKNEQDGKIQVMLVGLNGNLVFSQTKQFNKGLNRLAIDVDSRWAAGIYIVQVRNEKGAVIKNEKLVVQ